MAAVALASASISMAMPKIGAPAPDFHMVLLDGTKVSLADLRGQVVLLNFWATWCAPCKKELPLLDLYYRKQHASGLRMFAVTTEDSVPVGRLKPLAAVLTMPMVRRIAGGEYATVKAVPTNYIIDRAGILRYARAGEMNLEDLNSLLVPMLNEDAPPAAGLRPTGQ